MSVSRALMRRFPLKRAFITGAGSGLGRAFALQLAQDGWTLGLSDIHSENLSQTLEQVRVKGGQGETYLLDVSDAAAFSAVANRFVDAHGGCDLVINNAGVAVSGPLDEITYQNWQWIMGVNLWGPIHGCQAFIPQLKRQGGGHILNVASMAGLLGMAEITPYNTTKFAVVGLSESLRAELKPAGIGVSVLCPYFFKTGILEGSRGANPGALKLAALLSERSTVQADDVAARALQAAGNQQFYILPHIEGKVMWWLKRLSNPLYCVISDRSFSFQRQRKQ